MGYMSVKDENFPRAWSFKGQVLVPGAPGGLTEFPAKPTGPRRCSHVGFAMPPAVSIITRLPDVKGGASRGISKGRPGNAI